MAGVNINILFNISNTDPTREHFLSSAVFYLKFPSDIPNVGLINEDETRYCRWPESSFQTMSFVGIL